ncbi:MAG: glycosyltransferase [Chloroflexi bacterium]|nr:glycosyltransferase [Chloroflexota bacterium]
MPRLSVIIPALNEAQTLPQLLRALRMQTCAPDEIIVADAGSTDGTIELAREYGAHVVPGGKPGAGRNSGARAATGDVFLFLDADVLPAREFIATALDEFTESNYVVATTLIAPLEDALPDKVMVEVANLYLQVVQPFSPHAPGFCIIVRRAVHQAIGGFDEAIVMAEDHDYVQRAAKYGEFGVLTRAAIPVSLRRVEKDGLLPLAFKYAWCEMYALAGKPIYSVPFEYNMGGLPLDVTRTARRIVDIAQLREQLGQFENPIQRISAVGLAHLEKLAQFDWREIARERFQLQLDPPDAAILHRYLSRRLELIRASGRPLRETLNKLQTRPIKESIRLLDLNAWVNEQREMIRRWTRQ